MRRPPGAARCSAAVVAQVPTIHRRVASERVAALASAPARDELAVYRSLAAQEYCHTLARNVASLRALGAAAVSAAPRELDRAVLEAYLGFRQRRRV